MRGFDMSSSLERSIIKVHDDLVGGDAGFRIPQDRPVSLAGSQGAELDGIRRGNVVGAAGTGPAVPLPKSNVSELVEVFQGFGRWFELRVEPIGSSFLSRRTLCSCHGR